MFELELIDNKEAVKQLSNELAKQFSAAQLSVLLQKTPKDQIKKRLLNPKKPKHPKDNPELSFIEHSYVVETLNMAFFFDWGYKVVWKDRIGSEVIVEVELMVRLPNGKEITKTGFGGARKIENNTNQKWADVYKSAVSDGIKVAASKIGIGIDLYSKDEKQMATYEDNAIKKGDYVEGEVVSGNPVTATQYKTINDLGGDPESVKTSREAVAYIRELYDKKNKKGQA